MTSVSASPAPEEALPPVLQSLLTTARQQKEDAFARATDLVDHATPPIILLERAGQSRALITAPQPDRDQGLLGFHIGVTGYSASAGAVAFDAYSIGPNWDRSETPGPGELQQLVIDQAGLERGLVIDTLALLYGNRDGQVLLYHVPYECTFGPRQLTWGECQLFQEDMEGVLPESVTRSFGQQGLLEYVQSDPAHRALFNQGAFPPGLTDVEPQTIIDIIITRMLIEFQFTVALRPVNPTEGQLIDRLMKHEHFNVRSALREFYRHPPITTLDY